MAAVQAQMFGAAAPGESLKLSEENMLEVARRKKKEFREKGV